MLQKSDASQAHGAVMSKNQTELYIAGNTRGIIPGYSGNREFTSHIRKDERSCYRIGVFEDLWCFAALHGF